MTKRTWAGVSLDLACSTSSSSASMIVGGAAISRSRSRRARRSAKRTIQLYESSSDTRAWAGGPKHAPSLALLPSRAPSKPPPFWLRWSGHYGISPHRSSAHGAHPVHVCPRPCAPRGKSVTVDLEPPRETTIFTGISRRPRARSSTRPRRLLAKPRLRRRPVRPKPDDVSLLRLARAHDVEARDRTRRTRPPRRGSRARARSAGASSGARA